LPKAEEDRANAGPAKTFGCIIDTDIGGARSRVVGARRAYRLARTARRA
jgi:hypothetical protein